MKSIVKIIAAVAAGIFLTLDMSAGNGVEIGYLHSSYRTNLNSDEMKTASPMSGFQVGLMKDMNIVAGLSLQSGLTYSYLNSAEKEEVPMFNITGSYTEHMLNIPIQVKYTFDIIPAFGVYVFAGPTLSLGLAATTKLSVSGSIAGNTLEGNLKYNAYTNKPNDARTGMSFVCSMRPLSDKEAHLASDYIFVNGADSAVTVNLAIRDGEGNLLNEVGGINVPVVRGKLTVIRDEFLTSSYAPGIGIDPGFDGEIDIVIPD